VHYRETTKKTKKRRAIDVTCCLPVTTLPLIKLLVTSKNNYPSPVFTGLTYIVVSDPQQP
jgi:hypothetical protein